MMMTENKIAMARAFVQDHGNLNMPDEFHDVLNVLRERGVPVTLFTQKRLQRRQLPISHDTLVVGDHDTMRVVFRLLGVPLDPTTAGATNKRRVHQQRLDEKILPTDSYPPPLRKYMHRSFYETSRLELIQELKKQPERRVFVKPRHDVKSFTGLVVDGGLLWGHAVRDVLPLRRNDTRVYVSEPVEFVSEYRVFVLRGQILDIKLYDGDATKTLDLGVVGAAVRDLEASSDEHRTAAYALDFGILAKSGETALVEWNDAYALGSYGLAAAHYTEMLWARWKEIAMMLVKSEQPVNRNEADSTC